MTLFFVKLTLILSLGAVIAVLLRKRSAAARHFVWALTLGGALLLPVAMNVAPAMPVVMPLTRPSATLSPQAGRGATHPPRVALLPSARGEGARRADEGRRSPEIPITIVLWATGFTAMLLWLAAGHLAVWRIVRKATEVDGEWHALITEARERIRVRRRVRVVLSSAIGAPFTSGWVRPVILLPAEASTWPEERRRAALLHELAHIARNDAPVYLLAGLACALYWLHPAVWLVLRRLRRESEQATDDRVIAHGMVAPEYAAQLVDVARASVARGRGGLAAVAMACPSHLETRLRALLDETRIRGAVSRRLVTIGAAIGAAVLIPLAAARPELRAETRTSSKSSTSSVSVYERTEDVTPGGTLVLDLETGANVDIAGGDASQVQVRGMLAGRDAASTIIDTTTSGNEVRVSTKFDRRSNNQSTSHDLTIRVPRKFNVRLSSAGGGLTIIDVDGTFEGSTGGGTIKLSRVHGEAHLSTGGGDVLVTDSDLDGKITSGGGTAQFIRVRGNVHGVSGDHPVVRAEAEESREMGQIRITKAGGRIDLDEAPNGAIISTGGGQIIVGRASGTVEASTGGGQIRIGPIAGSARASTGGGSVVIDVADAGGEAQTIDVTTGSGSVEITLPSSFDGRFEIETAYTESHRPVEIRSEWDLQHQPVTGWDSHEGTPRRYVRARGHAGSGRGLVRIHAVNGDIRLHRD